MTLGKLRTGIKGLDEITHGGLPARRPTLICGSAIVPDSIEVNINLNDLEVFFDPSMEKVSINLFSNSINHGKKVRRIDVGYEIVNRDCMVNVSDDGVGIPASMKDLIFDKGVGTNTGYWLFLVREILSLGKMTIREIGKEGEGTQFQIRIPRGLYRIPRDSLDDSDSEDV